MILGYRVYVIATPLRVNKCETDVTIVGEKPYSKGVNWLLACPVWTMPSTMWTDGTTESVYELTWLRADAILQDPDTGRPKQRGEESRAESLEEDSKQIPGGGPTELLFVGSTEAVGQRPRGSKSSSSLFSSLLSTNIYEILVDGVLDPGDWVRN